jgi:DNA-directed RNA polymerase specialized sigma24 family protein
MSDLPADPGNALDATHWHSRAAAAAIGPAFDVERIVAAVTSQAQLAGHFTEPAQETQQDSTAATGITSDLLVETYQTHYASLLRLAARLLDDPDSCEDVVQEAFIRMYTARARIREPEKLAAYLRQIVVDLSLSARHHWETELEILTTVWPIVPSMLNEVSKAKRAETLRPSHKWLKTCRNLSVEVRIEALGALMESEQ